MRLRCSRSWAFSCSATSKMMRSTGKPQRRAACRVTWMQDSGWYTALGRKLMLSRQSMPSRAASSTARTRQAWSNA